MTRYLYRTLSPDALQDLIRKARIVEIYDFGARASRWHRNKCVPPFSAVGAPADVIVPLQIEVESDQEFEKLKALILQIKEGPARV